MTDNIQKLYETAGVERIYSEFNNGKETIVERVFSPYRQLELIKWLSQNTYRNYFTVHYYFNEKYWRCKCNLCESCGTNDFENALASVVSALWRDLTEKQKQEIKRILE